MVTGVSGMLRPARMKKFSLAVLQRDEDTVTNVLGEIGAVELVRERTEIGREAEEVEDYNRYLRNIDRLRGLLSTLEAYLVVDKKRRVELPRVVPVAQVEAEILSREEIKKHIDEFEEITSKFTNETDALCRRLDEIRRMLRDLYYFEKNKISLDIPGDYTHIFVKTGFVPTVNIPRLKHFLEPFDVVYSILEGRPRENLVVVAGSNKDRKEIERALTLVNFEEFIPPKDADPDPSKEIAKLQSEEKEILSKMKDLYSKIVKTLNDNASKTRYISFLRRAKSTILRTKALTIFDGWVPASKAEELKEKVLRITEGKAVIQIREPEEHEKPPTYIKHPGIMEKLAFLTYRQGIPSYNEVNPTPIYIVLFAIMYGMMFGDFGQSIILIALGLIFIYLKKPFLGFSASGVTKLGTLICLSGISGVIFGILYGECFLTHVMKPIWLEPMEDIMEIMVVALIFGIIQIVLGIILNIINLILSKETLHAIFSWKGVVGLIYYLIGIYLAIKFIEGGYSFGVFIEPSVLPFTIVALILIAVIIPASPTIINKLTHGGEPFSYTFMMGFGEFIEAFISYLTNTISYVRLAAFAVAHVALGHMAALMGTLTAYILINILAIILEGFVVAVQSLRLIYYEFSTKFFIGGGKIFRPLKLR